MDRIYYFSNDDKEIHNINDVDFQMTGKMTAQVGIWDSHREVLMVDDEVTLYTFDDIINLFNSSVTTEVSVDQCCDLCGGREDVQEVDDGVFHCSICLSKSMIQLVQSVQFSTSFNVMRHIYPHIINEWWEDKDSLAEKVYFLLAETHNAHALLSVEQGDEINDNILSDAGLTPETIIDLIDLMWFMYSVSKNDDLYKEVSDE